MKVVFNPEETFDESALFNFESTLSNHNESI